jgi:hypothetical protein
MSSDLSAVKKFVEEILIDLMDEKFMSIGVQASSMGGLEASPLDWTSIWAISNHDKEEKQAPQRSGKCKSDPISLARLHLTLGWHG